LERCTEWEAGMEHRDDGAAERDFPTAPSQAAWDAMSQSERVRVVSSLPNEVTDAEMSPPEGDQHFNAKLDTLDALRGFFRRTRRRIYLAGELPVYYPSERRFAPDVLAVLDVEDRERGKWVVSAEGKGLDFVLEVHFGGDRKKDADFNVKRYARLGIPEYVIYDRARQKLLAYQLSRPGSGIYMPVLPQQGRYASSVLGVELCIEDERLRFWVGSAPLLRSPELIDRLEHLVESAEQRADDEQRLREDEQRLREDEQRLRENEQRLREEAERKLAELEREVEKLKRGEGKAKGGGEKA
jgi:Uma2 family endonuclease